MQSIYLASNFNPIYWNTACLIVNSGSLEDNSKEEIVDIYAPEGQDLSEGVTFKDLPDRSGKIRKTSSTDYGKVAKAIGDIKAAGINVSLVNINKSKFGFAPDVENNSILFGLRGILNVGEDVVNNILANRPYSSPKDFLEKVNPNKAAMISLIKAGAFDDMIDRKICMGWYIWETCDKKSKLTLQNLPTLSKYNLLPEQTEDQITARRVYEFNRYLKAITKQDKAAYKDMYTLDGRAIEFLQEMGYDDIITTDNLAWFVKVKDWDKKYQKWMDVFRGWIAENKDSLLVALNTKIFEEDWEKYAAGTISAWEMKVLCFYYHEHELAGVNKTKYGFSNFSSLSEEPEPEKVFYRGGKEIPMFKLHKICGTCIAKDKTKSCVTLLTTDGVVNIKFRKEYFALFDKQISVIQADGTKKIMEKSWFDRGSMIVVQGIRSGDNFIPKKYSSSPGEQLYKISSIEKDGSLILTHQRYQGGITEDE